MTGTRFKDISKPPRASLDQTASSGSWPGVLRLGGDEPLSGTVLATILVCDLVDSTSLFELLGNERATALVRRLDRQSRDLLAEHGGREIDKTDGFLLLFDRPTSAVVYARAYHRMLEELCREEGVEVAARVGIHVGEVILYENTAEDVARGAKRLEVDGLAKPMASRLMHLAQGRQTLISRGVYDVARRGLMGAPDDTEGLHWLAHGTYSFKGVEDPVEVFEVGWEGFSPLEAPASTDKARRIFESEILEAEYEAPGSAPRKHRRVLATIALTVAVALAATVWFSRSGVELPRARPSISVLGFKNGSGRPGFDWLSTAFTEMLNTELAAGGKLRIVPGESVTRMQIELGLPVGEALAADTLDKIRRHLGTDYVVVGTYFVIGSEAERRIRLDFRLQATDDSNVIASAFREGTEKDLFALVEQAGTHLRSKMGLAAMTSTESKAARASMSTNSEATRFYSEGLRKLRYFEAPEARDLFLLAVDSDDEFALAHAALSESWLDLGYDEKAESSARRAFELTSRQDLPREEALSITGHYYEASAQWPKAIRTYQTLWDFFPDNVDYGLRLAAAQTAAGLTQESLATVELLRQLPEPLARDPRIDLAEAAAVEYLSDYERQAAAARSAVLKGHELGAKILVAEARWRQGIALRQLAEVGKAEDALRESHRLFTEVGDHGNAARALNSIAILFKQQGQTSRAEEIYRQALEIHQETGNRKGVSTVLSNLANVLRDKGDLAQAEQMLETSLEIVRELGSRSREAARLESLGWVLLHQGHLAKAEQSALSSRAMHEANGHRWGVAWCQYLLGQIYFARGSLAQARELYEKSLEVSEAIGFEYLSGLVLNSLGELLLAQGDFDAAAAQLDAAAAIRSDDKGRGYLAQSQLSRAALVLEQGRPHEAEPLASGARREFEKQHWFDVRHVASALLVEALLAQGRLVEARSFRGELEDAAEESQNPAVRLEAALAVARLDAAAGEADSALVDLEEAREEAERIGLKSLELRIRLAHGQVGSTLGDAARRAASRDDLRTLAAEARALGFGLIADKASGASEPESGGPGGQSAF